MTAKDYLDVSLPASAARRQSWLLAATVSGALAVQPDGVDYWINVSGLHYTLDGQVPVRLMISNQSLDPVEALPMMVETGERAEAGRKGEAVQKRQVLLFAPGLELVLERLEGDKAVWSRRVGQNASKEGKPVQIPSYQSQEWTWSFRPADYTDKEGLYRLRMAWGKATKQTEPFRLAKTLEKPEWISLSYSPDKEEYFLGEEIKVHFLLKNNGTESYPYAYGGDYRGAYRQLRFAFAAVSEDGRRHRPASGFVL